MTPRARVVVDLGYGDAGKGATVDWLCSGGAAPVAEPPLVVRFNGGAQAAHRVVRPDGTEHVFRQFGSGALAGAATHTAGTAQVDPVRLGLEAAALEALGVRAPLARYSVDGEALVTTPFHVAANRLRAEARGHGTCGLGIGEVRRVLRDAPPLALRVKDLRLAWHVVHRRLDDLAAWLASSVGVSVDALRAEADGHTVETRANFDAFVDAVRVVDTVEALRAAGGVVFEGAQGVLLDETYGFHPHTTWSTCTPAPALRYLDAAGYVRSDVEVVGVTRAYSTRHGPGPFPTEDPTWDLPDAANEHNEWQGAWRVGPLDLEGLRYALSACAGEVDALAVTCLDRVPEAVVCDVYGRERVAVEGDLAQYVGARLDVPLLVTSHGETWQERTRIETVRQ